MDANDRVLIKRVRRHQLGLVTFAVLSSLVLPAAGALDAPLLWPMVFFSWLLLPFFYLAFATSIERVTTHLGGTVERSSTRLCVAMLLPLAGGIFEIVALHRLATVTATLGDGRSRANLVVWLAVLRLLSGVVTMWLLSVVGIVVELPAEVVIALNPIVSLALLAVITQVIVQPVLDHAPLAPVTLAAAGAHSPMAVSTTSAGVTGDGSR